MFVLWGKIDKGIYSIKRPASMQFYFRGHTLLTDLSKHVKLLRWPLYVFPFEGIKHNNDDNVSTWTTLRKER